jgi:gamma-glutamyltranspeptidase/glutathione hydrolase
MTGIGGDAFAQVWWAADGSLVALDASGRAGSKATPGALREAGAGRMPDRGAATVSVPGAVSGWHALLDRYGTTSLADALATAIDLARHGCGVAPITARTWQAETPTLAVDPGARGTFLVDGQAPSAGDWFKNPDLARSMEILADQGPGALYGGELGQEIVAHLEALGGLLTLDDLEAHVPEWVESISCAFRGHRVWELPPAGQGIAVLEMLRLLEGFDLHAMGYNSPAYLHHLIEAKKLAFANLTGHVADRDHLRVAPQQILDDRAIDRRRAGIDPVRAAAGAEAGIYDRARDTIYLAVGDADGNMVSFINSIYWPFGSGVVVPGTGFVLQNRGSAFVLEEGHPNCVSPGKRPLHTIIPAMMTRDDQCVMAFGVVGRSMQPQGQVQLLLNLLLWGMDLQQAVDQPRVRHFEGREVSVEPGIPPSVRAALAQMGHVLLPDEGVIFGGAQAVARSGPGWAAASDPRRDGCALGY